VSPSLLGQHQDVMLEIHADSGNLEELGRKIHFWGI